MRTWIFSNESKSETRGYIYVLKSLSQDDQISSIRDLYKIGFSSMSVTERVANAKNDPTYLMAEVEIVESYRLTGDYNPQKVEHMIHKIFAGATLDLSIADKTGKIYTPREWYCVPITAIRHAVELIESGDIIYYEYSRGSANGGKFTKLIIAPRIKTVKPRDTISAAVIESIS